MPTYDIDFDFTTVHKGSRFTGRSGTLNVTTAREISLEQDEAELKQLCANFVKTKKPSFNIFMVQIKKIKQSPIKI